MKETKIAKENIEDYKRNKKYKHLENLSYGSLLCCDEHKQTCQRWLEFERGMNPKQFRAGSVLYEIIQKNVEDLKQAIKLYEENGI